jgi:hypothetical protein
LALPGADELDASNAVRQGRLHVLVGGEWVEHYVVLDASHLIWHPLADEV